MNTLSTNLLDKTEIETMSNVDKALFFIKGAEKMEHAGREFVYATFAEKGWEDRFSSWNEFLTSPDGLGKSDTWWTKHKKIHEFFVLEEGIDNSQLLPDSESLYNIAKSDIPSAKKIELATVGISVLSRIDIKKQVAFLATGKECEHPETVTICKSCHQKLG